MPCSAQDAPSPQRVSGPKCLQCRNSETLPCKRWFCPSSYFGGSKLTPRSFNFHKFTLFFLVEFRKMSLCTLILGLWGDVGNEKSMGTVVRQTRQTRLVNPAWPLTNLCGSGQIIEPPQTSVFSSKNGDEGATIPTSQGYCEDFMWNTICKLAGIIPLQSRYSMNVYFLSTLSWGRASVIKLNRL